MRYMLSNKVRYNSISAMNLSYRILTLIGDGTGPVGKGFILTDEYLFTHKNIISKYVIHSKIITAIFKR